MLRKGFFETAFVLAENVRNRSPEYEYACRAMQVKSIQNWVNMTTKLILIFDQVSGGWKKPDII